MLTSRKAQGYLRKIERVITTCVQDAALHIMNLRELSGHRQGLSAANINVHDMNIFQGTRPPLFSNDSNCLTVWGFDADTTQFDVRAAHPNRKIGLNSSICEPELIVHTFENGVGLRLILANLCVRSPREVTVTEALKKLTVTEALRKLESEVPVDSATQPIVPVLGGACYLSKQTAEEATQPMQPEEPNWRTVWQEHATTATLSGDLIFVKGAHAKSFDLPLGPSHRNWGVRNRSHDAIAIELRVKAEAEPEPEPDQSERFLARTDNGPPACE